MSGTVLLASRNSDLQHTRSLVLKSAGFRTICVSTLEAALTIAHDEMADVIVIGHSFSVGEQCGFLESMHAEHVVSPVVCLHSGVTEPSLLVHTCTRLSENASEPAAWAPGEAATPAILSCTFQG